MSNGSTLPPVGGLAELGISYSTLQSTCSGTLKSLTRYEEPVEDAGLVLADGPEPDLELAEPTGPEAVDEAAAAAAAAAAAIRADGTPTALGLGYGS